MSIQTFLQSSNRPLCYKVKATIDSNDHTFISADRLKIAVTLPDMRHNGTVITTEQYIVKQCLANIVNKKKFCHNDSMICTKTTLDRNQTSPLGKHIFRVTPVGTTCT